MRSGALSVMMLACLAQAAPAYADCTATNRFNFTFSSQAAQTLSYAGTYNYTATNGLAQNATITASFFANGLASSSVAGQTLPAITDLISGPGGGRTLVIGGIFTDRTPDIAGNTRVTRVTFTFLQPIRDFFVEVHDVDYTNNQFRDWMGVTGTDGTTTYTPLLETPYGTSNNGVDPTTNTNSSIRVGSPTSFLNPQQAYGISGSANTGTDTGTISASFEQPVTSVTLTYGNYPLTGSEWNTGQQGVGIERISFCPMPDVDVTKTSAPVASSLGAFNLPENDVIYTITVTNNGGSPVDANSLVLEDGLPSGITFRNTAFDGTTSLPFKVTGVSGVTLSAAGISYSQTGNASFGYTPAAGYDAQVDAFRVVPSGQLPANSSVSVQFRGRIN
jgi:uncharacterized repeat protein (TIGR01451 family)